jgi:hypothetical protein
MTVSQMGDNQCLVESVQMPTYDNEEGSIFRKYIRTFDELVDEINMALIFNDSLFDKANRADYRTILELQCLSDPTKNLGMTIDERDRIYEEIEGFQDKYDQYEWDGILYYLKHATTID